MPKKGENTKKVAGNAKKAEAAAQKAAVESSKKAAVEDAEWTKGSKSSAKKYIYSPLFKTESPRQSHPHPSILLRSPLCTNSCAHAVGADVRSLKTRREEAEAKKADALRKKAEKDALLAAEERSLPSGGPKNTKSALKKTSAAPARRGGAGGLNLDQLDDDHDGPEASKQPLSALNATGIDNALDALSLTSGGGANGGGGGEKIDRHPERRFKAAYAAYEARRMPELEEETKGLRRQQRVDVIRKEFEKSPENPFNQVSVGFDASKEEVKDVREREREKVEVRLGGK
ncbi:MAG: hypothetical protein LQ352_002314 [Teloschistes flavicans]|nr:MAG: hypothetical protein LQ352_002314 [Teloschistes flavicans]